MDQVHVIRDKVLRERKSVRRAAREAGISRNTARKYLADGPEPPRAKRRKRQHPVLEHVAERMAALLQEWLLRTTAKQHVTATLLHKTLRAEQFQVGLTTVRVWLAERRRVKQEVFVPLEHYPGDEAQVDFFEVTVDIGGVRGKAWMLLIRMMHSGRDFAWLYRHCDQVSFIDGHVRAFAHFGGVPRRLLYDNLKAAVKKILKVGRELSGRFEVLVAHYVFEANFARPRTGHDKGGVESRGHFVRLQHMTPIPAGESLALASQELLARLDSQAATMPDDGKPCKMMVFEQEERPKMLALFRGDFDPRALEFADVNRSALVRLAGAHYSVPTGWHSLTIESRVGVEEIELRCRGEVVMVPRQPKGGKCVNYRHYLPELRKKPQAVRQVMPALLAQLGEPFGQLWRLLVDIHGPLDAARIFARVLGGMVEHGEGAVRASVTTALTQDRLDLLMLLPRPASTGENGGCAEPVAVPAALAHHQVEARRAAEYDYLLQGNDDDD